MSMATGTTSPTRSQTVNPVGPDGVVRCLHNVAVEPLTSNTTRNPGRKFYHCCKSRDDPDNCRFFKWVDELPGLSQGDPSEPKTPAKRLREAAATTPSTPNVSPSKVTAHAAANRSRFRSHYTDEDEGEDIVNYQSDEEISHFLRGTSDEAEPPTKKFKFHKTVDTVVTGPINSGRDATPRASTSGDPRPFTPTKTSGPVHKTNQWEAIQGDPESPFHARAAALRSPGQPLSSPAMAVATGDSITQALNVLSTVPDTVRKLERKLNATEKARDSRAARIVKLEKEIQDLKDRNQSLEEAIETLKARG